MNCEMSNAVEELCNNVKEIDVADLAKLNKVVSAELERRVKSGSAVSKKAGSKSAPKGVVPPQLLRPRAWIDFTLNHALNNGWESFVAKETKKDKATGVSFIEEIELPGSEFVDGAHLYIGSVTEENPEGKQIDMKGAMSLSKIRWCVKDNAGTHHELYNEFLEEFNSMEQSEPSEVAVALEPKVVRKTVEEKEAEKAAKEAEKEAAKAAKEAAKAAKEAEKEAVKEAAKAVKEAAKAAKEAAKEAEKEAVKAAKEAEKEAAKAAAAAAAAPKKVAAVKAVSMVKAMVKAVVKAVPVAKAAVPVAKAAAPMVKAMVKAAPVVFSAKPKMVAEDTWSCEKDGAIYPWTYKGTQYLRDYLNQVWREVDDGTQEWCGVYDHAKGTIDDSIPEPECEEEEEEENE